MTRRADTVALVNARERRLFMAVEKHRIREVRHFLDEQLD